MLRKGTTIQTAFSEYVIDRQIAQGGNGTVFQAHDAKSEEYAVKAIDRNKTDREKLGRFKNEIGFCENNDNPHVIKIIDHGTYTADGVNLVFYVMPLYDQTLRGLMNKGIAPENVLPILTQILSGLRFAHEKGIWHRDIKPENILIDRQGNAVIADFGIAHFSSDDLVTAVETKQSDRLANFQYAAPEQREKGKEIDGRADIYAVGMILNEMFTRSMPLGVGFVKIGDVNLSYAYLDSIVEKMLQQNPGKRLYPVDNVATSILIAQKDEEKSKELLQLTTEKPDTQPPLQIIPPSIRLADYRDGCLILYLDGIGKEWAGEWFRFVQNGNYTVQEIMGYGRNKLSLRSPDILSMRIPASDEHIIGRLVDYIKGWIAGGTIEYNNALKTRHLQKMEEERKARLQEIKRLQDEEKMRMRLTAMFQ